jgi:serine protease Do
MSMNARLSDPGIDEELSGLAALVRRWTVEIESGNGRGGGVVWHSGGLIVSNAHVARGARAKVSLPDGDVFDGRVLARDDELDLAALVIPADDLRSPPVANPEALVPGSLVFAQGHPWGVRHALSLGVVHSVSRDRSRRPRYVATDIRLAPGNSGGPLVDATGRLVGINAMIVGGLGVAIPVNVVQRFLREAAAAGTLPFAIPWAA